MSMKNRWDKSGASQLCCNADYNKAIELETTMADIYYNRANVLYYL